MTQAEAFLETMPCSNAPCKPFEMLPDPPRREPA